MKPRLHTLERPPLAPRLGAEAAIGTTGHLRPASAGLCVALCACAFTLAAIGIRPFTSVESRPLAIAKLEEFLRDKDRYELVAVGNSHVYRQVVPEVLEVELAGRGIQASAYNLGAPSMSFDELAYLLREIAAARPERLRWVLVGLTVELGFAARTTDVFQLMLRASPYAARLDYVSRSLQYDFNRFASRGEGPEILRRGRRALRGEAPPLRFPADGFTALDDERLPNYWARHTRLLASQSDYSGYVAELARKRGAFEAYSPRQAALMAQLAQTVRAAGAEPIFLMPPSFEPALFFSGPEREAERYRVLRYHDPALFPELFLLAHRFDMGHLNRAGAEIFTRLIARDLVRDLVSGT